MKKLVPIIVIALILFTSHAEAKTPGHLSLQVGRGITFPGIASEGTSFFGKNIELSAVYDVNPDAKLGLIFAAGIESNSYRHFFDEKVFVEHGQRGISSGVYAWLPANERFRVLVGIETFVLIGSSAEIGEKRPNETFFYGNDSVWGRYVPQSFRASAVVCGEFLLGKYKRMHVGLKLTQSANSPVHKDATYVDANGTSLVISRRMKPATIQFYIAFRILPREKRKEKLFEKI